MIMLQKLISKVRDIGITNCEYRAKVLSRWHCRGVNLGGGRNHWKRWPTLINIDAQYAGGLDFNTCSIPLETRSQPLVVCEQVIEHLHNTTWFLSECNRILKIGGQFLLSTENLASLPNLFALCLGKAPFSTQAVCGTFIGGFRPEEPVNPTSNLRPYDPAFSGVRGHVRVMTKGQLVALLKNAGFKVNKVYTFAFNHYVLFDCEKETEP